MNSRAAVRELFKTVLQQVSHFKVDVIAGDANAAAYKYYKKQEHHDLYNSSVAIMLGHPFESGFTFIILPIIIRLSFTQQMIYLMPGQSANLREQIAELLKQTDYKKGKTQKTFRVSEESKPAEGDSPAGLSRGRHRSHGGTSKL